MSRRLIAIIVAAVLVVAAGGIGVWKFVLHKPAAGKNKAASAQAQVGPSMALDKITTDLSGDGSQVHYVSVTLNLQVDSSGTEAKLKKIMPQVRSTVILTLRAQTYAGLQGQTGADKLKAMLISQLNQLLAKNGGGKVQEIYFEDFIVQ